MEKRRKSEYSMREKIYIFRNESIFFDILKWQNETIFHARIENNTFFNLLF